MGLGLCARGSSELRFEGEDLDCNAQIRVCITRKKRAWVIDRWARIGDGKLKMVYELVTVNRENALPDSFALLPPVETSVENG